MTPSILMPNRLAAIGDSYGHGWDPFELWCVAWSGLMSVPSSSAHSSMPGAAVELADPEHDELGRLDRGDADLDGQDPGVAVLGRVVLLVALDVERLGLRAPEQRTVAARRGAGTS